MAYRKENKKNKGTLANTKQYSDTIDEKTRQNLRQIYEVLGRELVEKLITSLCKTIERYTKLTSDEIDSKLKKLNECGSQFEYYICDKCDGLGKYVKATEKMYSRLENSDNDILKEFLDIDYDYEGLIPQCPKCNGTGIVDWVRKTRQ